MRWILSISCTLLTLGWNPVSSRADEFFTPDDAAICEDVQAEGYTLSPEGIVPALLDFASAAVDLEYGERVDLKADPALVRRVELYLLTGVDCENQSITLDLGDYFTFDDELTPGLTDFDVEVLRARYAVPLDPDSGLPVDPDTGDPLEPLAALEATPPEQNPSPSDVDAPPDETTGSPEAPPPSGPGPGLVFVGPRTRCVPLANVIARPETMWDRFFLADCGPNPYDIAPAPNLQVIYDDLRCPGNRNYPVWAEECQQKVPTRKQLADRRLAENGDECDALRRDRDAARARRLGALGAHMAKPLFFGAANAAIFAATAPASGTVIAVTGAVAVASSAAGLQAHQGWAVGHTAEKLLTRQSFGKANPWSISVAAGELIFDALAGEAMKRILEDLQDAAMQEQYAMGQLQLKKVEAARLRREGGNSSNAFLTDTEGRIETWFHK